MEFALLTPLVLVFVLGLVDFGIAIDRRLVLDHAVREGARYAAVGGQALTTGVPATVDEIRQYTAGQSQDAIASDDVAVCYQDANGDGWSGNTGDSVQVSISYTHDFVTGFTALFDLSVGSIEMTPRASARLEEAVSDPAAVACS